MLCSLVLWYLAKLLAIFLGLDEVHPKFFMSVGLVVYVLPIKSFSFFQAALLVGLQSRSSSSHLSLSVAHSSVPLCTISYSH